MVIRQLLEEISDEINAAALAKLVVEARESVYDCDWKMRQAAAEGHPVYYYWTFPYAEWITIQNVRYKEDT